VPFLTTVVSGAAVALVNWALAFACGAEHESKAWAASESHHEVARVLLIKMMIDFAPCSCNKSYLYQSSLKKHFTVSHEAEYKKYLAEKHSKLRGSES